MKAQFASFVLRWLLNSIGLMIGIWLVGSDYVNNEASAGTYLIGGLVLSLANAILRPIVVILAIPAILLTLGLFMLVVNGLMVYLAVLAVPNLDIGFFGAILISLIISVINYVVSTITEKYRKD